MPSRRHFLASTPVVLTAGCLDRIRPTDEQPQDPPNGTPDDSQETPFDAAVTHETVVRDLEVPWDIAFAGDDVFITERPGGLLRFDRDAITTETDLDPTDGEELVARNDLPGHYDLGEGGTLGVTPHADYPDPADVFVYYTHNGESPENTVIRYSLDDDSIEPILEGIPGALIHNGGRLTTGPDDRLWVLTGDADDPPLSQDPASLAGAVLRITPTGDPATDNPTIADDADPRTFTYGHRNPQGIGFLGNDDTFVAEHGPIGRDELHRVKPGENYGWPVARGGPDDEDYAAYSDHDEFHPPLVNTTPDPRLTWAPSGIGEYTQSAIPEWRDTILVGGLISQSIWAIILTPNDDPLPPTGEDVRRYDEPWHDPAYTATAYRLFENEFGRVRHVTEGPNGDVYVLTSNQDGRADHGFPIDGDDRVIRISPT